MTSTDEDYEKIFNYDAKFERMLEDDNFDIADLNENQRKMSELKAIEEGKLKAKKFFEKKYDEHNEKLDRIVRKRKRYAVNYTSSTFLAAYANVRLEQSDVQLNWPLEMEIITNYLYKKYERQTLVTELSLAMLELCLKKVPIQISWDRGNGDILDLDKPGVINFEDKCMESAIEILIDLIDSGIVSENPEKNDLRIPVEIINSRRKK